MKALIFFVGAAVVAVAVAFLIASRPGLVNSRWRFVAVLGGLLGFYVVVGLVVRGL